MFDRLKFSASAAIGLLIGICLALPLFWLGVKSGVGALRHTAQGTFEGVERRLQNMSDEALRLEIQLKEHRVAIARADFAKIELLRSRLAGSGDFDDKIEISQDLDRALVNIETIYWQLLAANKTAAQSPYIREFGRNWGPMKRYLVDEEYHFSGAVNSYNNVLATVPVPYIVAHRSFGSFLTSLAGEIRHRLGVYLRQAWAWIKFAPKFLWALVRNPNVLPQRPEAIPHMALSDDSLFEPLPRPFYITQAPVPEEDYPEIQYDRDSPDMADVEVGQQKAVLENDRSTPYVAPVPTIQRTVTYK